MALSRQEEQRQRRSLAGSDTATSYFQQAQAAQALDEPGGRFATGTSITGSAPSQQWPSMPSGPWSGADLVPPEPPIDIDVSYVEPCGTADEIRRSLAKATGPSPVAPVRDVDPALANSLASASDAGPHLPGADATAPAADCSSEAGEGAASPSTDREVAPTFRLRRRI